MTLRAWIEKVGVKEVMQILQVDEKTVYQWKTLTNCPKDQTKRKIYKATRGKVSYADMIEPFLKARAQY